MRVLHGNTETRNRFLNKKNRVNMEGACSGEEGGDKVQGT